jgi:hypothetical protein
MPYDIECLPRAVATKAGYYQALAPTGELGGRITLMEKGDVLPTPYGGFGWRWISDADNNKRRARTGVRCAPKGEVERVP